MIKDGNSLLLKFLNQSNTFMFVCFFMNRLFTECKAFSVTFFWSESET